jgi:alpha-L-fucosidase
MKTRLILAAFAAASSFLPALAVDGTRPGPEAYPPQPEAVKRWRDLRFGMFIHWGPVSLKGTEIGWSRGKEVPTEEYDNLYKQFNPTGFNADEWVAIAKASGMKYMVLTTKHHDGFCLWDTKETDYNIMNTPFKRDVVKELAEACKKEGIWFGAYYSTCDWYHPDFPLTSPGGKVRREKSNIDSYNKFLLAQIRELITNYGPLLTIWNDVPQEFKGRGAATIKMVRELQPDILINNRTGDGGDYDTPEQRVGAYNDERPWETCMTICRQWAWKPDDKMKSLKECVQTLIACIGGDGNLLFNVGPMPDGKIEARQIDRLKEMGAWVSAHGEAIYGTRGGPWKPTKAVASTRKGSAVYVHILRKPAGKLELPDLPVKVKSAAVLGGAKVPVAQGDGKLVLDVAGVAIDPVATVIRLDLEGSAMGIPAMKVNAGITATASNVFGKQEGTHGADAAFDGDSETRWATDAATKQAWIAADYGRPIKVGRARIIESQGERIQKFEIQYKAGGEWKTVCTGSKVGRWFEQEFEPVTASEFRVNILEATDGPSITDLEFIEN